MNNKVYTEFYNIVLYQINDLYPVRNDELLDNLRQNSKLEKLVTKNKIPGNKIIFEISQIVLNLIDDGLVRGTVQQTNDGYLFKIDGLTTQGHDYLSAANTPEIWKRIKKSLHENGIPRTPRTALNQFIKLFF